MGSTPISFSEKFNAAEYFVDRNVISGFGGKTAIYFGDEKITCQEVLENVNRDGKAKATPAAGKADVE